MFLLLLGIGTFRTTSYLLFRRNGFRIIDSHKNFDIESIRSDFLSSAVPVDDLTLLNAGESTGGCRDAMIASCLYMGPGHE